MNELLVLVQKVSFVGIIAGAFTMSRKSWLRNLWWICLLLCVGSSMLSAYWDEVVSACTTVLAWLGWGVIALAIVIVGIRLIRKLLLGRRV